jgi:hypothetical protein
VLERNLQSTHLTERKLGFIGLRISPHTAIATVKTAGAAVVWAAVGHSAKTLLMAEGRTQSKHNLIAAKHKPDYSFIIERRTIVLSQ